MNGDKEESDSRAVKYTLMGIRRYMERLPEQKQYFSTILNAPTMLAKIVLFIKIK